LCFDSLTLHLLCYTHNGDASTQDSKSQLNLCNTQVNIKTSQVYMERAATFVYTLVCYTNIVVFFTAIYVRISSRKESQNHVCVCLM